MEGCFAMREKLQRFMYGRYGVDRLNRVLMTVSMVFLVLSIFRVPYAYIVAVLILFYTYYRMLSRQIGKRAAENQWYLKKEMKLRGFFQKKKKFFKNNNFFFLVFLHSEKLFTIFSLSSFSL